MPILAIQNPVYQQAVRVITSISNAAQAVVVTSFAHNYISGMIVRINIPYGYGMQQINQLFGQITVINATSFSININTITFDPFTIPAAYFPLSNDTLVVPEFAQVVPFGENAYQATAATRNVLNGNPPFGFPTVNE